MDSIFLVTGATSGIGKEIALGLLKAHKHVGMIVRNKDLAAKVVSSFRQQIPQCRITCFFGDLSSQNDIKRIAQEIIQSGLTIDGIINNAGVVMAKHTTTVDGIETTFAVNHLSHFLLIYLLMDKIKENPHARIISIASDAHTFVKGIRFDDIGWKEGYRPLKVYGQSKLANILFVKKLARLLKSSGITVNAVDPGAVATRIGTNNGLFARFVSALARPFFRPIPDGAKTAIYLALSDEVKHMSGELFKDNKVIDCSEAAKNDGEGERLWNLSLDLCHLKDLSLG